MKLVNINYRGRIVRGIKNLKISRNPPCQALLKVPGKYTLIVFSSGKCRLMGCKQPIRNAFITVNMVTMRIDSVQSMTVTADMQKTFILQEVAKKIKVIYEPELFPAARILEFHPLCVNLFASGKVVVTGLKTLNCYEHMKLILDILKNV